MATFKFRNLKTGQAIPVPVGEFTVGRDENADVRVDDSSVSRHHARLINDEHGFFVEDLGSANGVALEGAYISGRVPVKLGDHVHIGKMPFRIDPEVPGEPAPPAAEALTQVDRAALRRETEAIPAPLEIDAPVPDASAAAAPAEAAPFVAVAPLSAAITYTPSPDQPEPNVEPTKSGPLIRHSVPLPKLIKLTETPVAVAASTSSSGVRAESLVDDGMLSGETSPAAIVQYGEDVQWWWWLIMFLAGMGSGLLLGLYFAKLFLDLGGKPAALPG